MVIDPPTKRAVGAASSRLLSGEATLDPMESKKICV
jgi:hypothetical protein